MRAGVGPVLGEKACLMEVFSPGRGRGPGQSPEPCEERVKFRGFDKNAGVWFTAGSYIFFSGERRAPTVRVALEGPWEKEPAPKNEWKKGQNLK